MKQLIPHNITIAAQNPLSAEQLLINAKKKDLIRRLDIALELAEDLNKQVKENFKKI